MKTLPTLLKNAVLLVLIYLISAPVYAQFSKEGEAKFYTGISPVILPKDGIEVNFLNSLTSFWLATNEYFAVTNSTRIANRYRFTRFQQLLRVNYGFSSSGRWDLGAEFQYTHSRIDDEARSSPFRVLGGDTESGETDRGMSMAGLRLRVMPFDGLPELTVQGMAHFYINRSEEKRAKLGAQRSQVGLLATFYQQLSPRTFYFLQGDWRTQLASSELDITTHTPSLSGFLVIDAWEQTSYIFPGLTYSPTLQKVGSGSFVRVNQQLLGSIGGLIQPSDAFGIMLNWQIPFILESGSQRTEWVRESFSSVTLGLRMVL
jgi:hypothetical protein